MMQAAILRQAADPVREAYEQAQGKYQDVLRLEQSILELHQMFVDFALLTEQQGELLDQIEYQVCQAGDYIVDGNADIEVAIDYQKAARKKQCCLIITLLIIAIVVMAATGMFGGGEDDGRRVRHRQLQLWADDDDDDDDDDEWHLVESTAAGVGHWGGSSRLGIAGAVGEGGRWHDGSNPAQPVAVAGRER